MPTMSLSPSLVTFFKNSWQGLSAYLEPRPLSTLWNWTVYLKQWFTLTFVSSSLTANIWEFIGFYLPYLNTTAMSNSCWASSPCVKVSDCTFSWTVNLLRSLRAVRGCRDADYDFGLLLPDWSYAGETASSLSVEQQGCPINKIIILFIALI